MVKRLSIMVASLLLVFSFTATAKAPPNQTVTATSVWKITTDTNTVYLAGTIHALRDSDYPLPAAFELAFNDSEHIVFESDLSLAADPAFAGQMMQKGIFTDGTQLSSLIDKKAYDQAIALTSEMMLPAQMVNSMEPWLVGLLTQIQMIQKIGFKVELGVDYHLHARATAEGKSIGVLEEAMAPIDALDQMPIPLQVKFLQSGLIDQATVKALMEEMVTAWRTGDATKIDALMKQEMGGIEDLMTALLDDRNRNWMPSIQALLTSDKNSMVAVGAGHLAGENSVIDLLEKAGYTVTQVK